MGKKVKQAAARTRTTPAARPKANRSATPRGHADVVPVAAPEPRAVDAMVDDAVDSLRRLLSELLEHRLDAVSRELAEVRREVAAGADPERLAAMIDALLDRLGAVRFAAEPLDVVDPLIHAVVEERAAGGVPRGVIVASVRPGFRSGRGHVLCKAAVAVSGG